MTLADKISEMQNKLQASIKEAASVKENMQFNLFKFMIIAFVCVFFGFVVVHSTLKTLGVYFNIKKNEQLATQKYNTQVDGNEFLNFENDGTNYKSIVRKGINKSNANQNKLLRDAKLETIASDERKKDVAPEDYKLEADINMNSIDKTHDEYKYVPNSKHYKSFWQSLFVNKDYEVV